MGLNIAIVGTGNLAYHFTKRFYEIGNPVKYLIARNEINIKEFLPFVASDNIISITEASQNLNLDLVIIAVSDSAINGIIEQCQFSNQATIVHCSGSQSIAVFKQAEIVNYGVIYPLQTFSKEKEVDFKEITVFIESNSPVASETIMKAASMLSPNSSLANSEKRLQIHLSAIFACNFTNELLSIAEEILERNGLTLNLLKPLVLETVNKAMANGASVSQTGPAVRGDNQIIEKHLKLLEATPPLKVTYDHMTQLIQNRKTQS